MDNRSEIKPINLASFIDHTQLKPDTSKRQIVQLCREAKTYGFATVCVNPYWVALASEELRDSPVGITTVVGFPLGSTTTYSKVHEADNAIHNGATEIDMVMNIGALKSGDLSSVRDDITGVVDVCRGRAAVKVILETCFLTDEEKRAAAVICKEAGADFVKTSTGFGTGGATIEDIKLLRDAVGPHMGVKASGGIRDADFALRLKSAGATRIGASASVQIVSGTGSSGTGY
jgi:deoxyribose-phosphate aldolase